MPAGWKNRINKVPLLGRLLAMLRGVYTLPVWRQALRDDVQSLRTEIQQVRDALTAPEALAARHAHLASRAQLQALEHETQAHLEAIQLQHQHLRLELLGALRAQLSDLEYRVGVLQSAQGQAGVAISALPVVPGLTQPLVPAALQAEAEAALLAALQAEGLQGFAGFLATPEWSAPVAGAVQAQPCGWVLQGWCHWAPGQQQQQLQQARANLQAGGWFALCCPNPENLLVLARAARCGWPGLLWPAQAEALMLAAGFAAARVHRFHRAWPIPSQGAAAVAEGPESALALALSQPQYYWLVGRVDSA